MAFDALRPHASQITGLISQGRTLTQIIDILASQHGVNTTPGTLSRFASSLKPARHKSVRQADQPPSEHVSTEPVGRATPLPELTPAQHLQVDVIALFTELHSEFRALRDEHREKIGHLSGKISLLNGNITELETVTVQHIDELKTDLSRLTDGAGKRPEPSSELLPAPALLVSGDVVRRIWLRALVVITVLWALISGVIWWLWPVAPLPV